MTSFQSDPEEQKRSRIYPVPTNPNGCTVPLSILEAKAAPYEPAAGVWMFRATASTSSDLASRLQTSFTRTISAYPQWAGHVHFSPFRPKDGHSYRHGRLMISYGGSSDVGVEFVQAKCDVALEDVTPNPAAAINKRVDITHSPFRKLLPTIALSPQNPRGPCMAIQITTFSCGGVAIGFKLTHVLADAQTSSTFLNDWANMHRSGKVPVPLFDPSLLDKAASGNIDDPLPDRRLIEISRAAPLPRYDWWVSKESCPPAMLGATAIPAELVGHKVGGGDVGDLMPWKDWDTSALPCHYLFHIDGSYIIKLWEAAGGKGASSSVGKIGRMDTLMAHLWILVNRARGVAHNTTVHLTVACSIRQKISPPLPDNYIGVAMLLTRISSTSTALFANSLKSTSSLIHSTITGLTHTSLSAVLHDMAHEISAQRFSQAFFGQKNIVFTSWVHSGLNKLDFGEEMSLSHVQPILQPLDGCIQVMETCRGTDRSNSEEHEWYSEGVIVDIQLMEDAMSRLFADPLFAMASNTTPIHYAAKL